MNVQLLWDIIKKSPYNKNAVCIGANCSKPTLDRLLSGGDCKISTLEAVCAFLKIPVSILFEDGVSISQINSGTNSASTLSGSITHNHGTAKELIEGKDKIINTLELLVREKERLLEEKDRRLQIYESGEL